MNETNRPVRRAVVALVVVLTAYFLPGASWSPVSRFCLTRAVVERGSLEITKDAASTGDRAEVGGRYFSDKAPVPSLLAVPAYAAFHALARARGHLPAFRAEGTPDRPAQKVVPSPAFRNGLYVCSLSTSVVSAGTLAFALHTVLRRRVSRRAAAFGTVATLVGTPIFPYATSFFGHAPAAAFLFVAFALTDPLAGAPSPWHRRAAGACLALAVGSEYPAAVPAGLVGAFAVFLTPPGGRIRAALALLQGALLPLLLLGAYHAACFGSPFRTGYSFITHPAFASHQATGFFGIGWPRPDALFGILFSGARGLFYVSPIAALGVLSGALARRDGARDPALPLALAVFGSLVLVNAGYFPWDGGAALGPRHLVPALGFVGLGIGHALERWPRTAGVAASASVLVLVLATGVALEVPPDRDVVFGYVVPALADGVVARIAGASNWGLLAGLGRKASLVPPFVVLLGFVLAFRWLVPGAPGEGPGGGRPERE